MSTEQVQDLIRAWTLFKPDPTLGMFCPPETVWSISLFLYCIFIVKAVDSGSKEKSGIVEFYLTCVLTCYGGSIIVPSLLGNPCGLFRSYEPILAVTMAFILYNTDHLLTIRRRIHSVTPIACFWSKLCDIGFELFRVATLVGWIEESRQTYTQPKAFFGPIILGTLGGCGGVFMPLSKGLLPLGKGVPYNVESAFFASFLYHLLTIHYAVSNDDARATVATCLVILRMLPSKTREGLQRSYHGVILSILGLNGGSERLTGPKPKLKKN